MRQLPHFLLATLALSISFSAFSEEVACVTTTWNMIGANHRVCVYAFDDPKIPGVTCHVSQAKTGGVKGSFGLAEDPSQFSLACRQIGPITLPAKLPEREIAFSENTSLLFKETAVHRTLDKKRNVLIYLAISRKVIEGAPANAISTVPIQLWGGK